MSRCDFDLWPVDLNICSTWWSWKECNKGKRRGEERKREGEGEGKGEGREEEREGRKGRGCYRFTQSGACGKDGSDFRTDIDHVTLVTWSKSVRVRYVWRVSALTDHSQCRCSGYEQTSLDWQSSRQSAAVTLAAGVGAELLHITKRLFCLHSAEAYWISSRKLLLQLTQIRLTWRRSQQSVHMHHTGVHMWWQSMTDRRSAVYRTNKIGPKTDPCAPETR